MAWSYDEYGFPIYTEDNTGYDLSSYDPYDWSQYGLNSYDPYGSYYSDPMDSIDWSNINWDDPAVREKYGLTDADFETQEVPINDPYGQMPSTLTNDQMSRMWDAGIRDFAGMDLTDEQIRALRDAGVTTDTSQPEGEGSQGFWQKVMGGLSSMGGSVGAAAAKNPMSAIAALLGGGAGIAALAQPSPKGMSNPNFAASTTLSPEQKQLLAYIQSAAGREDMLQAQSAPISSSILNHISGALPGLAGQSAAEQIARNQSLQNVYTGLGSLQNPNQLPGMYQPFMNNANEAERLIAETLAGGAGPTLEAQRLANERRSAFEEQQLNALGPGYVTSYPYNQAKATEEAMIREGLEKSGLGAQASRLSMLSGVSLPRAQLSEQGMTGQTSRNIATSNANLANYQGLNTTADTIGKLAAIASGTVPSGSAQQGLSAVSGIGDKQQELLNSIYQFNSNIQNQKNQNLWQFAGTALGGGLYGLQKKTT